MTRLLAGLWAAVATTSVCTLGVAGSQCWNARDRARSALFTLRQVAEQTSDIARLRADAPDWMRQGRPSTGLTPRVSAALAAAGLPPSALASLSPEAESSLGDPGLKARRTRAVLTLAPVTLPQLGGFFGAWRSREPQWTITTIELAPHGADKAGAPVGGDLPIRAAIGLETMFVEQGGGR